MDALQELVVARIAGDLVPESAVPALPDPVSQVGGDVPFTVSVPQALHRRQERLAEEAAAQQMEDVDGQGVLQFGPEVVDVLERLYAEIEDLRQRTGHLADALGACPR